MRVVHGPGFRLCVFGYNRFLGNWAQKKNRPHTVAKTMRGRGIENRTTRNKRRYDLLVTSLPQQHEHQACNLLFHRLAHLVQRLQHQNQDHHP